MLRSCSKIYWDRKRKLPPFSNSHLHPSQYRKIQSSSPLQSPEILCHCFSPYESLGQFSLCFCLTSLLAQLLFLAVLWLVLCPDPQLQSMHLRWVVQLCLAWVILSWVNKGLALFQTNQSICQSFSILHWILPLTYPFPRSQGVLCPLFN